MDERNLWWARRFVATQTLVSQRLITVSKHLMLGEWDQALRVVQQVAAHLGTVGLQMEKAMIPKEEES